MIARPALTALEYRSCQHAISRAVAAAGPSIRHIPLRHVTRPPQYHPRKLFATETFRKTTDPEGNNPPNDAETVEEKPWFLEEDLPEHSASQHHVTLPQTPEGAPALLGPLIKYVYEDMGLDDISLLDLRELDPPASLGPNLIMMLGTARSERHLHISSGRLVRWIRRNYGIGARADGLIGPGELKTKLRRLRKKAKLMGSNTAMIPGGDNGISTGWVCVNFDVAGEEVTESANFDETGQVSGFGAPRAETTIVIQCLTESRREELDLESLWKGILGRSLQEKSRIRDEQVVDKATIQKMVDSKHLRHETPSDLQWKALRQASLQHRHYSTVVERSPSFAFSTSSHTFTENIKTEAPDDFTEASENLTEAPEVFGDQNPVDDVDFNQVRKQLVQIQYAGTPLSQDRLLELIASILKTDTTAVASASERLGLVDQLLLTAQERGLKLWSSEMLVTLLENVVTSPAYGPELLRAQENLELLITESQTPPELEHTCRLMKAYAHRKDWDRCWDAFRAPARFNTARPAQLYELAYQLAAETGNSILCTKVLRWVYPEMITEKPPILPTGKLYQQLKACILVADPAAEELLYNPPTLDNIPYLERRRIEKREFVRVLREVEALRDHQQRLDQDDV